MKRSQISVIGDGGWGTTIAIHLAKQEHPVILWGAFKRYTERMRRTRVNSKFLPGIKIPRQVEFSNSLVDAIQKSKMIVLAVPSKYMRKVIQKVDRTLLKKRSCVILSKGLEVKSNKMMSQVVDDVWGKVPTAIVSGPCISREVAKGIPTAVAVGSRSAKLRRSVRHLLNTPEFTCLESADVHGIQLAGSLKNVIAIAAGILDGLGYGSNTKSVLLARGIAEIARLGQSMGANRHTFLGLSGLGDLATTCFSEHSRNHAFGIRIGKGASPSKVLRSTEMVIEGAETSKAAYSLSKKHRIRMPITKAVYEIVFERKNPKSVIDALMHKEFVREID